MTYHVHRSSDGVVDPSKRSKHISRAPFGDLKIVLLVGTSVKNTNSCGLGLAATLEGVQMT